MVLEMFLVSVVMVLLLLLSYYTFYKSRMAQAVSNIPGPRPWPIVGNCLEFGFTPVDIMENITRLWLKHGVLVRAWLSKYLYILIADPKHAEAFFTSTVNIRKSMHYHFLEPWLGTGLLTSTGDKWRHHRKILTPTFHFKILEQFLEVFNTNGNIFIKKWKKYDGGSEFDIHKDISLYALDVICEAAMGVQMNLQVKESSDYLSALHRVAEALMARSFSPWYFPDFIYNISPAGREFHKYVNVLHEMSNKVIANRKIEFFQKEKEKSHTGNKNDIGEKRRLAFLDLLLQYSRDGSNLTDVEIREEVDTFMFEGHDTTTSGLNFCLWLLAKNPHCQEKAYQEICDIFGDSDRDITAEDLTNMKYLECVIKESLRLYPSVPFFMRELDEDVKTADLHVVAGTSILLAPFFIHRHPDHYPDPERFDPDRFTVENSIGRNPYAYVPFSAGSRNCIGQKFAMMEMKSLISKVLKNYKLLPGSKEVVLGIDVILKSQGGIFLKLESRK